MRQLHVLNPRKDVPRGGCGGIAEARGPAAVEGGPAGVGRGRALQEGWQGGRWHAQDAVGRGAQVPAIAGAHHAIRITPIYILYLINLI